MVLENNHAIKRKYRLMQVTHDLAIGGLQKVVVNLCRGLDREKFELSVLCLRNLGELVPEVEEMGIPVFFIPQPEQGTDYFSFLKAARIIREQKIEILHTHNTQPLLDGTMAKWLSGVQRMVHTDHARAFPDKKRYMMAERFASMFVHRMVAVSENTAKNLHDFERIPWSKLSVIPNGIDIGKYNPDFSHAAKRQSLGLPTDGPLIGMAGRLSEEKGVTYLLRAMGRIIREHPAARMLIAGNGTLMKELKAESRQLGIADYVFFLGPRMDIPEILGLLDIFVLPSLREGLPMVLLEAMAAGCAVVASEVGGIPALIRHDENGFLVPPGQAAELSNAINSILHDKDKKARFVENSKVTLQAYSLERMVKSYETLYLEGLN